MGDDSEPAIDHLKRMEFLDACISEALRINTPISYLVPRIGTMPTQLGKYAIPAQRSVIINLYAIHHNDRNWSNGGMFNPERHIGTKRLNADDTWVPFASGPRQCPARNFALYELRVLTSMLLREYKWKLPPGSIHSKQLQNAFSPFALSVPHNLDIEFESIKN